jgi:hypothetical protein
MIQFYTFVYDYLVDPENEFFKKRQIKPIPGYLNGYRRNWEVAVDNQEKEIYLLDGETYQGKIAILNLYQDQMSSCPGAAIPTNKKLGKWFRSQAGKTYYLSQDLRESFSIDLDKPLYTWLASRAGVENYLAGEIADRLIYDRHYFEAVENAFAACGAEFYSNYKDSTDWPNCPGEYLEKKNFKTK